MVLDRSLQLQPTSSVLFKRLGKETERFLAFPILAVIARRPMTCKDVSRTMLQSLSSVLKRLRQLEKMGYAVKRADRKWEMKVALSAIPAPSSEAILYNGSHEAPEPDRGSPWHEARRHLVEPVKTPVTAAEKLAAYFKSPESIEHLGVIGTGALGKCSNCGRLTPLRYGNTLYCPVCARKEGVN